MTELAPAAPAASAMTSSKSFLTAHTATNLGRD